MNNTEINTDIHDTSHEVIYSINKTFNNLYGTTELEYYSDFNDEKSIYIRDTTYTKDTMIYILFFAIFMAIYFISKFLIQTNNYRMMTFYEKIKNLENITISLTKLNDKNTNEIMVELNKLHHKTHKLEQKLNKLEKDIELIV